MITIKSQELKQFEYLKELLEENINDKTTEETTCYALWGTNPLELDPPKESANSKKAKKEKKKKEKKEAKQEPSVISNGASEESVEVNSSDVIDNSKVEEQSLEEKNKETVNPYPILRLKDGIFAGYSRKDQPSSLYYAFQSDVYYNFQKESNIESILRSNWMPTDEEWHTATLAIQMINKYGITKYSEYPPVCPSMIRSGSYKSILLVDQPIDDESVVLGSANEQTFDDMLLYAFDTYMYANIYVKLHPDTIDGKKEGYLQKLLKKHGLHDHPSIHVIDTHCNITSFFSFVDEVLVVSSQVGFEALLRNKSVRCFGMPFYSGWGLTTDMQTLTNQKPQRSIMELFIALVLNSTLYLNPFTNKKGSILDLLEYVSLQQRHSNKKNVVFYNTPIAEHKNVDILLDTDRKQITSITKEKHIKKHIDDFILTDTKDKFKEIEPLKYRAFVAESFLFPTAFYPDDVLSLILDHNGPYYDPHAQSDLDYMLNHEAYTNYELESANKFIEALKGKYLLDLNRQLPGNVMAEKQKAGKKVIFVPGQSERADMTFVGGELAIPSDYELLVAICQKVENCLIIYKPGIGTGVRKLSDLGKDGLINLNTFSQERKIRIVVEFEAGISHCIDAADEVHVLNHNCGIEAIVKGKKVVTYGLPFYGGMGLTEDRQKFPRPRRQISIQEFVLATLMLYPRYKVPNQKGFANALSAVEYDKNKHLTVIKPTGFFSKIKSWF
jgi:capsular polysaccharide export protein